VIDRRSVFFVLSAVVAALMIPLSEPDLRWVPEVVAVTYVVLAVLSFLDYESRRRGSLRRAATQWRTAPRRALRRRAARRAAATGG
jgi:O-antigen/teichoic acid export membrane protein